MIKLRQHLEKSIYFFDDFYSRKLNLLLYVIQNAMVKIKPYLDK